MPHQPLQGLWVDVSCIGSGKRPPENVETVDVAGWRVPLVEMAGLPRYSALSGADQPPAAEFPE